MNEEMLSLVRKRLPKDFRLYWYSMSVDYPQEVVPIEFYPPTLNIVQVATKRGILGLFKGWKSIGEIHIEEDVVYLWHRFYDSNQQILEKVISPIRDKVSIKRGESKASRRYNINVEGNRGMLDYQGRIKPRSDSPYFNPDDEFDSSLDESERDEDDPEGNW